MFVVMPKATTDPEEHQDEADHGGPCEQERTLQLQPKDHQYDRDETTSARTRDTELSDGAL